MGSCYKSFMSDRKYRQRGYQDDDRGDRRGPRRRGPREKPEGPRGRGLGAPTRTVFRCAACGHIAELGAEDAALGFDAACAGCGAALHTCTHCRHFDTSARFECRQPLTERVASKTKANRCELFEPKAAQETEEEQRAAPGDPDDPRAAFDALFKL